MTMYMSCMNVNVVEAMGTGSSMFSGLLGGGLGEEEPEETKRLVKGINVRSMESTGHGLYRLGADHMLNSSTETLEKRLARIDVVTKGTS